MGRELLVTEKLPALSSAGDLLLADFSKYLIGLRLAANFERNNAPGWMQYATDFRLVFRIDGLCAWSAPITPTVGSTLSCFVALGAR
jgi:HK97 family phage major capsid protein